MLTFLGTKLANVLTRFSKGRITAANSRRREQSEELFYYLSFRLAE